LGHHGGRVAEAMIDFDAISQLFPGAAVIGLPHCGHDGLRLVVVAMLGV